MWLDAWAFFIILIQGTTENCSYKEVGTQGMLYQIPYFPAHKTHRDFFVRNFRKKKDECILILVIYWKKTGLLISKLATII